MFKSSIDILMQNDSPEIKFIFWISFAIFLTIITCILITKKRDKLLELVNGNKIMLISIIIICIGFILTSLYSAFSAIDSSSTLNIKHFFKGPYGDIIIGIFVLIFVYAYSKVDSNKMIQQMNQKKLEAGRIENTIINLGIEQLNHSKFKRFFVIIIGIIFGIILILHGLSKI